MRENVEIRIKSRLNRGLSLYSKAEPNNRWGHQGLIMTEFPPMGFRLPKHEIVRFGYSTLFSCVLLKTGVFRTLRLTWMHDLWRKIWLYMQEEWGFTKLNIVLRVSRWLNWIMAQNPRSTDGWGFNVAKPLLGFYNGAINFVELFPYD